MQRLLTAERAELACDPTLATARALLEAYLPRDAEQARFRREMLEFLEAHPEDAHRRSCVPGHLTASSLVVDRSRGRALLTHHKKLERWLQLGGHCDGDSNLLHNSSILCTTELSEGKVHTNDEFPVIIAGRGGGRLKGGYHWRGNNHTASHAPFTALRGAGVPVDAFGHAEGRVTDVIGELFA